MLRIKLGEGVHNLSMLLVRAKQQITEGPAGYHYLVLD
jgi:hypothetical protein